MQSEAELRPYSAIIVGIILEAFTDIEAITIEFIKDLQFEDWDKMRFRVKVSCSIQETLRGYDKYLNLFDKTIPHDKHEYFILAFEII